MKKNILRVIHDIEKSLAKQSPRRVFRGEPVFFEKVSSGLYRTYGLEMGEDELGFNIEKVEDEMVEKARAFTDKDEKFEILCEIQHRGGKTNQIDFTRDLGVALFFACGTVRGQEREPGRVIMLEDSDAAREAGIGIRDITHPIHMAAAQKSVFVSTDSGYLDRRHQPHVRIWTIEADEKQEVLQYLKGARGIDSRSIFMDISGFIRYAHEFEDANVWLYRGSEMFREGDFDGAIEAASNCLRLDGGRDEALYLRGQAYFYGGHWDKAFPNLRRIRTVTVPGHKDQPLYPLDEEIEPKLAEWCKERERIELATQPKAEEAQASESDPRMLECMICIEPKGDVGKPVSLHVDFWTDVGYGCQKGLSEGTDLRLTLPSYLLDHDAACWWTFFDSEHERGVFHRNSVLEDFEIKVQPNPGFSLTSRTVQVTYFAYNPKRQSIRQRGPGQYELVSLA